MPHVIPGTESDPEKALADAPVADYSILLSHQPAAARPAINAGARLVLAGHTHGGQYFPFNLFINFFQPFARGLYHFKGAHVHTTTGTGTWGPQLRLGAHHELPLLILSAA